MVVIPFPGSDTGPGRHKANGRSGSIGYADTVVITFSDGGMLSHKSSNGSAFKEDLPSGYFAAGSVIFSSQSVDSDQTVNFTFQGDQGEASTYELKVTSNPPPPSLPKKKKK